MRGVEVRAVVVVGEDLLHQLLGDLAGGVLLGKEEEDGQVRHLPQVLHLPLGTQHLGMHHIPGARVHNWVCLNFGATFGIRTLHF